MPLQQNGCNEVVSREWIIPNAQTLRSDSMSPPKIVTIHNFFLRQPNLMIIFKLIKEMAWISGWGVLEWGGFGAAISELLGFGFFNWQLTVDSWQLIVDSWQWTIFGFGENSEVTLRVVIFGWFDVAGIGIGAAISELLGFGVFNWQLTVDSWQFFWARILTFWVEWRINGWFGLVCFGRFFSAGRGWGGGSPIWMSGSLSDRGLKPQIESMPFFLIDQEAIGILEFSGCGRYWVWGGN